MSIHRTGQSNNILMQDFCKDVIFRYYRGMEKDGENATKGYIQ